MLCVLGMATNEPLRLVDGSGDAFTDHLRCLADESGVGLCRAFLRCIRRNLRDVVPSLAVAGRVEATRPVGCCGCDDLLGWSSPDSVRPSLASAVTH